MAHLYREKVSALRAALNNENEKAEAAEIIRTLIDEVTLTPHKGELTVDLKGDIAGILNLCQKSKSLSGLEPEGLEQIKLVAGVGFEPTTFRL